jgi:Uma2 family endonuclease
MGIPQPVKRYTPQEYYALERDATYKSDYYDGEIFAMAGGTTRHSIISVNVAGELRQRLKGIPCAPYESNQRLKVKATGFRCYPDVSIYCGELQYDAEDPQSEPATNPIVLFEVLSKSTEGYDRGFKAENYRLIPTLRAYIFISQDSPHVEVVERQPDGGWLLHETRGLDATLVIPGLDVQLPMAEIYDRIKFSAVEIILQPRLSPPTDDARPPERG